MNAIEQLLESIEVKQSIIKNKILISTIEESSAIVLTAFKSGNRVFFCGNGGSAADAQHLAAELSGRFNFDRPPLPAEACHVNTSYITAVANDYAFKAVYSRYIEGAAREGDILIALSTSGNSENILEAIQTAKKKKMIVIGLTGQTGGKMKETVDFLINVPSTQTPRIQESHITIGHIMCDIIERKLFKDEQ